MNASVFPEFPEPGIAGKFMIFPVLKNKPSSGPQQAAAEYNFRQLFKFPEIKRRIGKNNVIILYGLFQEPECIRPDGRRLLNPRSAAVFRMNE
jgi:hypothetical protein